MSGEVKDNMSPRYAALSLLMTVASAATFVIEGDACPDKNNEWLWWAMIWLAGLLALVLLAAAVFFFMRRRGQTVETYSGYSSVVIGPV